MSSALSEDHRMLVDAVREYARGELIELDRAWDREEASCCTHLEHFYEMGLLGLRAPQEVGGLACPFSVYAPIIRELAYASPSVAVTISVHNMVADILGQFADDSIRGKMVAQLATPGNLAAFAISEPDVGSDPAAAKTRAEPVEGGWKLYGSKMWVTNGLEGRWFVLLVRTGDGGSSKDLSMVLLDARQDGVDRRAIHGKMGIRGSETAEMNLDGAFVPQNHLLGQAGDGLKIALSALNGGRIGIAAQALGIGRACFDLMVDYAKQREQFGQKISQFQAIQWMIADSETELTAAELLIERAAQLRDLEQDFVREAAMAKLHASETANRVAYRAVQIHGGYGYCNEFRVEQLYRDARITTLYEGTSEIQRYVIARSVLGE